jgi:hypothetical protein
MLHSLRHFSASMLVASGRDVRTIAGRLGHSDATTTLRVSAHMFEANGRGLGLYIPSVRWSIRTCATDVATSHPAARPTVEPGTEEDF